MLLAAVVQLSALVLSKLLQSCPDMNGVLRAGYLVGDTEPGGRSSCLSMNNKVGGYRQVVHGKLLAAEQMSLRGLEACLVLYCAGSRKCQHCNDCQVKSVSQWQYVAF